MTIIINNIIIEIQCECKITFTDSEYGKYNKLLTVNIDSKFIRAIILEL